MTVAEEGILELSKNVDSLITIPNQNFSQSQERIRPYLKHLPLLTMLSRALFKV